MSYQKKCKIYAAVLCFFFVKSGNEESQSDTSKQEGDPESDYQPSEGENSSDEMSEGDLTEENDEDDDDNDHEDYQPEPTPRKVLLCCFF